jgi:hypothetical protein
LDWNLAISLFLHFGLNSHSFNQKWEHTNRIDSSEGKDEHRMKKFNFFFYQHFLQGNQRQRIQVSAVVPRVMREWSANSGE